MKNTIVKNARSPGKSVFNFLRNHHLIFHNAPPFWCPFSLVCSLLTHLPDGILRSRMCGLRPLSLMGWRSGLSVCLPREFRPNDSGGLETRQSWQVFGDSSKESGICTKTNNFCFNLWRNGGARRILMANVPGPNSCSAYHLQIFFGVLGVSVGIFIEQMVKKRKENGGQQNNCGSRTLFA